MNDEFDEIDDLRAGLNAGLNNPIPNASHDAHDVDDDNLEFFGEGATYFGIVALNVILTILTLGLYYPWAKAAYRKYIWNEMEFKESRFVFNGTGLEMFKGFAIAYGILVAFYLSIFFLATTSIGIIAIFIFYILLIALVPLAIFGGWRYRVTRTSWRGIFFRFDGQLSEFLKLFFVQGLLTIITFGIYSPWMRVKLQKYLFSHTGIGDLDFDFHGEGGELFGINILGAILMYPTLGIYVPVWIKNRFNFTIDHTSISDGEQELYLDSTLRNKEALSTLIVNGLLLVVTLGLAFPWTFMRTMRMYCRNVIVPGEFDFDNLEQSEYDPGSAEGDQLSDIFDLGLDF